MDYYREFRIASGQQRARILGQTPQTRFPLGQPPSARPHCARAAEEAEGDTMEVVPERRRGERSPRVQAQVKQLQFWLKVFSRFCHDEPEAD